MTVAEGPSTPTRSRSGQRRPHLTQRPRATAGLWDTHRHLAVWGAIAYLITFLVLTPLLWVVFLSFRPSTSILAKPLALDSLSFNNYRSAFNTLPLAQMYGNTLLLAIVSVSIGTVISFMSSYALSRMIFRRRRLQATLRYYLLAGLAIPVAILLFPVYRLDVALGFFGHYIAVILPYIAVTLPFNTLLMTGFLSDFPAELEDAAVVDGVGWIRMCTSVVLPLSRPIVATVIIFNLIYVFNEYPFVSVLGNGQSLNTVSLALSQFQGQYSTNYGAMMAASTIILVPQIAIYVVFQRQVIAGLTTGAVKG